MPGAIRQTLAGDNSSFSTPLVNKAERPSATKRSMFLTTFSLDQKLPCYLNLSYQLCSAYVTMLFTQKLPEYVCQPLFSWVKVTVVFYVSYQVCTTYITMIFAHKLSGYVFNKKNSSGQKLARCLIMSGC